MVESTVQSPHSFTPSLSPSRATMAFWNLWRDLKQKVHSAPYLLIDCAGIEGGRQRLPAQAFARLESLFAGDLADELADMGPYLGQLVALTDEVGTVVLDLLDRRVAVLVVMPVMPVQAPSAPDLDLTHLTFSQLHRHLRKFNVIYNPDSSPLYFRYYDPRVLEDVLRVMLAPQVNELFGPIDTLVLVNEFRHLAQFNCRDGRFAVLA